MSISLKQACLDVANEIEAGTLVPGVGELFFSSASYPPCCSLGHVLKRANEGDNLRPYTHLNEIPHWGNVAEANDRKDWPEVISWLRSIADMVDGPSETLE